MTFRTRSCAIAASVALGLAGLTLQPALAPAHTTQSQTTEKKSEKKKKTAQKKATKKKAAKRKTKK